LFKFELQHDNTVSNRFNRYWLVMAYIQGAPKK